MKPIFNIFFLTSATNSSGGARQALQLAQSLRARGHNLLFFTQPQAEIRSFDPELPWRDLDENPFKWKKNLEAEMADATPYIVQGFHNKAIKMLTLAGLSWRLKGRKIACAAYRGVIYKPRNPLPYILPGISHYIVNSNVCAAKLPLLWRRKRLDVIYNSVVPAALTPTLTKEALKTQLSLPDQSPVIGCIVNNALVKGLDILLKAVSLLDNKEVILLAIGADAENWLEQCRALGIESRVFFTGKVNDVGNYLQLLDVQVIPSRFESLPNALLEGMSFGLPIIATTVGDIPELIDTKEFLVPKEDAPALVKALNLALSNQTLRQKAGEQNRQRAQEFSLENRTNRMEGIYEKLWQNITA